DQLELDAARGAAGRGGEGVGAGDRHRPGQVEGGRRGAGAAVHRGVPQPLLGVVNDAPAVDAVELGVVAGGGPGVAHDDRRVVARVDRNLVRHAVLPLFGSGSGRGVRWRAVPRGARRGGYRPPPSAARSPTRVSNCRATSATPTQSRIMIVVTTAALS